MRQGENERSSERQEGDLRNAFQYFDRIVNFGESNKVKEIMERKEGKK